jgi:hypothetical protein
MLKYHVHRCLLAIVTIVTLCFLPALSQAAGLSRIVVVGIPADTLASVHPTPEYPRTAWNLHISGDVMVTVHVEHGKVMETTTSGNSSILAASAARWVEYQWKFRSNVSGVFRIPISYRDRYV